MISMPSRYVILSVRYSFLFLGFLVAFYTFMTVKGKCEILILTPFTDFIILKFKKCTRLYIYQYIFIQHFYYFFGDFFFCLLKKSSNVSTGSIPFQLLYVYTLFYRFYYSSHESFNKIFKKVKGMIHCISLMLKCFR